jgi:DNA-binding NarL/FixJ family response regulator
VESGVRLSARQRQVAERIAQFQTDRQIALGLGLSFHTVRGYAKQVLKKLGVHKRTAVALRLACMACRENHEEN